MFFRFILYDVISILYPCFIMKIISLMKNEFFIFILVNSEEKSFLYIPAKFELFKFKYFFSYKICNDSCCEFKIAFR